MKHTAIFYTHNKISPKVLKQSLISFCAMVNYPHHIFETCGIVISVEPVREVFDVESENIINLIAPNAIINNQQLSIIDKILHVMKSYPSDYVSLHEHDTLYPKQYLHVVQNIFLSNGKDLQHLDYLAYNNLVGVNGTGYQKRIIKDYPLSTLSFPSEILIDVLEHKRQEYYKTSWCYLEPGYGGSYGSHLRLGQIGEGQALPVVHINMNLTDNNHHLTDHYLTYEAESSLGIDCWPGDLSFIF